MSSGMLEVQTSKSKELHCHLVSFLILGRIGLFKKWFLKKASKAQIFTNVEAKKTHLFSIKEMAKNLHHIQESAIFESISMNAKIVAVYVDSDTLL